MSRNIKSLCCVSGTNIVSYRSILLQKETKQTHRKSDQICGQERWEIRRGNKMKVIKGTFPVISKGCEASQVALVVKNLPADAGNMRRGFHPWVG